MSSHQTKCSMVLREACTQEHMSSKLSRKNEALRNVGSAPKFVLRARGATPFVHNKKVTRKQFPHFRPFTDFRHLLFFFLMFYRVWESTKALRNGRGKREIRVISEETFICPHSTVFSNERPVARSFSCPKSSNFSLSSPRRNSTFWTLVSVDRS